jgi:WH2 motif
LPPVKDSHVDLMEEIRRGGTLKHVSPEKIAAAGGGVGDTRNELMGQIRQGVTLKRVTETVGSGGGSGDVAGGGGEAPAGIAGMLQRALQERGMVMGMSSSEEESDGCDEDDEWDD